MPQSHGPHPIPAAAPTGSQPGGGRWFASNRRDGSRQLSSALIVLVIALVGWQQPLSRIVAGASALISLAWWLQYRRLVR